MPARRRAVRASCARATSRAWRPGSCSAARSAPPRATWSRACSRTSARRCCWPPTARAGAARRAARRLPHRRPARARAGRERGGARRRPVRLRPDRRRGGRAAPCSSGGASARTSGCAPRPAGRTRSTRRWSSSPTSPSCTTRPTASRPGTSTSASSRARAASASRASNPASPHTLGDRRSRAAGGPLRGLRRAAARRGLGRARRGRARAARAPGQRRAGRRLRCAT